jgi:hypothetical protein
MRTEQLQDALEITKLLVINSQKQPKVDAQISLIEEHTGQQLEFGKQVLTYKDPYPEHSSSSALEVARNKAYRPRRNPQGFDFEMDHSVATTGADINAWVWEPNQDRLLQEHKFDRQRKAFNDQRVEQEISRLIRLYSGKQKTANIWDVGWHIKNGADHQIGDKIEVRSKPIDRELLTLYIMQALENGLFYSSNLHIAALECLAENGQMESIAFLPKEFQDQGIEFTEMRQAPTKDLTDRALHSVIANVPVRYNA